MLFYPPFAPRNLEHLEHLFGTMIQYDWLNNVSFLFHFLCCCCCDIQKGKE